LLSVRGCLFNIFTANLHSWRTFLHPQPEDAPCSGDRVRSLYRAGSLLTVSRELARYKFDLVGVQEVRWEDGGTEPVGEYKVGG
jgi:hypothetical protein